MQQLPQGSKILIYQDPRTGLCHQVGAARLPNGDACQCGGIRGWVPSAPSKYGSSRFELVTPAAAAQIAQQVAGGSAQIGNTYTKVDLPNMGASGVARTEGNASPAAANQVFAVTFDNTLGATSARQFLGDYTGTYALQGNTEVTPGGFVVAGSWGTNSKSQFVARTIARPWRVKSIQFIASNETFFNLTNSYYFDTTPAPSAGTKDSLSLTNLLSADQYNPKIQWYSQSVRFDGVNGLDILIPAGQSITLQFGIVSERSAGEQVLIG